MSMRPLTPQDFTADPGPLKASGMLPHAGWDLPTRWAVGIDGRAWKDSAHGDKLRPAKPRAILQECEDLESALAVAEACAIPIEERCCSHCGGTGKVRRPKGWGL
jgi:hypothetical protein